MAAGLHALMLAMLLSDPARIRGDSWKFPGSSSSGNVTDTNASRADNSSDISGRNAINININTNPSPNSGFAPFPEGNKPFPQDAQININGFNPHPPPHFKPPSYNPYALPNSFNPPGNTFKGFSPAGGPFNTFGPNSGVGSLHRTQTSPDQKPNDSGNSKFSSQVGSGSNSFGTSSNNFGTSSNGFGTSSNGFGTSSNGFGTSSNGFGTSSNGFADESRQGNDFSGSITNANKFNRGLGGSGTTGKFGGGINNFGGFNPLPPPLPPQRPGFIPPGFGAQCTCVSFYLCKAQDIVMGGPGLLDQRSSNKNISAIDSEDDTNTTTVVTSAPEVPPIFRTKRQAEGNETSDENNADVNETDITGRSFRPFPGPNGLPSGFPPQPPPPSFGPQGGRPITQTPGCGPMQVCCRNSIIPGPPPGPKPRPVVPPIPQCGVRNLNGVVGRVKNPNLVEGETQFGEFPWQGAVLRKDGKERMYVCGATLISPTHVLTAAHCVNNLLPVHLKVRLGEWDVSSTVELYPYLELNVMEIRIHPMFYPGNLQNDIAVLRMDFPVDFAQFPQIAPVCLPPRFEPFVNRRCIVTGWGKDAFGFEGQYQNILKQVDLPVIDNFDCENRLKHTRLGPQFMLLPGFMCAGGEPGKDACKGDGGSPLVCETEHGYVAAGIVSWGIGCGHPNIPGVYVRVSEYLDWIRSATAF